MGFEVYAVTVSGNLLGQFVQNVLHVGTDNTVPRSAFAVANDIAITLENDETFFDVWLSMLPSSYRVLSMRVRRVDPVHAATVIALAPTGSPGLGARGANVSAQSNCPICDFFNEFNARRIGKVFMPGVSETDIEGGIYTAAYQGAFVTNWQDYFNQVYTLHTGPGDFRFGIFSRTQFPKFLPTSDVRLSPLLGTLRRRLKPAA